MAALSSVFDIPQKPGDEIRIQQSATKIFRGGAAGIIMGTGFATPLVVATSGMQFIGVSLETNDNTLGTPGTIIHGAPGTSQSSFIRIARKGIFAFNQTGLIQANVGMRAFFSDDNTISVTPGACAAGVIVTIDEQNGVAWVCIDNDVMSASRSGAQAISGATDAVPPHTPGTYVVTTAGVDAMTLAAPAATTDDGLVIIVTSNTANAHTITATGLLQTGGTTVNVATFAAHPGASVTLMAYQGKWNVISANAITFT